MNQFTLLVIILVVFTYYGGSNVPKVLKDNKELLLGVVGGLVLCSFLGMRLEGLGLDGDVCNTLDGRDCYGLHCREVVEDGFDGMKCAGNDPFNYFNEKWRGSDRNPRRSESTWLDYGPDNYEELNLQCEKNQDCQSHNCINNKCYNPETCWYPGFRKTIEQTEECLSTTRRAAGAYKACLANAGDESTKVSRCNAIFGSMNNSQNPDEISSIPGGGSDGREGPFVMIPECCGDPRATPLTMDEIKNLGCMPGEYGGNAQEEFDRATTYCVERDLAPHAREVFSESLNSPDAQQQCNQNKEAMCALNTTDPLRMFYEEMCDVCP